MSSLLEKLAPNVPRSWLPRLAALTWAAVGAMLLGRAAAWIRLMPGLSALALTAAAAVVAWWLSRRAFIPIVERNLERLAQRPESSCAFGVFPWRSWLMVILMVVMGITLRRFIPPVYLIAPYVCMGLCLWAGAMRYIDAGRQAD